MQNNTGLRYSAILHGIMLLLLIFGLPEFLRPPVEDMPNAMTDVPIEVSLVPNMKNEEKAPEIVKPTLPVAEKNTALRKTQETQKPIDKPTPPTPPVPEKKQEEVKKAIEKKAEVKPPKVTKPDVKTPPVKKEKEQSLDDILKGVENQAKKEQSDRPTVARPNPHNSWSNRPYNPGMPLTGSELGNITHQFEQKWNPPTGAKDAQSLKITVKAELNENGEVLAVELYPDEGRYNSSSFQQAAAQAAVRAAWQASPIKNLDATKFDTWRIVIVTFDPRNL